MLSVRQEQPGRPAFTLIELLVVIGIIALLVALAAAGVFKVLRLGPKVQTRYDISQLELSIRAFKQQYEVDYLPSSFVLKETYDLSAANPRRLQDAAHVEYLKKVFGQQFNHSATGLSAAIAAAGGTGTEFELDGNQCLVFFLGGVNQGQWLKGFSNNGQLPFNHLSQSTPLFDFPGAQITPDFHFLDRWGRPYTYMTATNRSYDTQPTLPATAATDAGADLPNLLRDAWVDMDWQTGALDKQFLVQPYGETINGQPRYVNPGGFQIISWGEDQTPGPGGVWMPEVGVYSLSGVGADDMGNFNEGVDLGSPSN